jgi:exonuclease SbcC
MINQIQIKNFQSHKDTILTFSPGVNVITGSSDHGKSAIIKALRWLIWNKPSGDDFRSHWGGDTEVTAKLEDGVVVSRIKKGSENLYKVDNLSFTAFGASVPEEVEKILNLTDINLQQQLNLPFLLTETPGNVAKHFNRVAKIDKINKTEKKINSEISQINLTIGKHEDDIQKYELELKELPNLEKIEIKLEKIEKMERKRNTLSKNISDLRVLIRHIDIVDSEIIEDSKLLTFEKKIDQLIAKTNERDSIEDDMSRLDSLMTDIRETDFKTSQFNRKTQHEGQVNNILIKIEKRRIITANVKTLQIVVDKIYYSDKKLVKTKENVVTMEVRFKEEMGDVCVLCGSKLT